VLRRTAVAAKGIRSAARNAAGAPVYESGKEVPRR